MSILAWAAVALIGYCAVSVAVALGLGALIGRRRRE